MSLPLHTPLLLSFCRILNIAFVTYVTVCLLLLSLSHFDALCLPSPSTFHSRTTADNRKIKFLAWKSCSLKADVQTGVLGGRSIPQFRGSSSQGAALLQALVFVCLF